MDNLADILLAIANESAEKKGRPVKPSVAEVRRLLEGRIRCEIW